MKKKYQNVIVIGCDKTGKSTLIKGLEEANEIKALGYDFFKGNKMPTPEDALQAAIDRVRHNLKTGISTVYDRFHFPDDIVYHPVTSGEGPLPQELTDGYFKSVFPYLKDSGTLIIYCVAPADVIAKRFVEEKEELIDVSYISELLRNYNGALAFLQDHFNILELDSSVLTTSEMFWIALGEIAGRDVQ